MNPIHQADAIQAARRAFRQTRLPRADAPAPTQPAPDGADDREQARQTVSRLRRQFWTLDAAELSDALETIDTERHPELAAAVHRLREIAALRPEFTRLAAHDKIQMDLFNALRRVAVLPPREAGPIREALIRRIQSQKLFRPCRRSVRTIQRHFPHLYALEPAWLQRIATVRKAREPAEESSGSGISGGWAVFILIYVLVKIVVYVSR